MPMRAMVRSVGRPATAAVQVAERLAFFSVLLGSSVPLEIFPDGRRAEVDPEVAGEPVVGDSVTALVMQCVVSTHEVDQSVRERGQFAGGHPRAIPGG